MSHLLLDMVDADTEALVALWIAAWTPVLPQIDFTARQGFIRDRLVEYRKPPKRARVLEENGVTAGFSLVDPVRQDLEQIAVAPACLGKGAAQTLLDDAKRIAGNRLTLSVNKDNPRALAFYSKHGFGVTREGIAAASGLPIVFMEWKLHPKL